MIRSLILGALLAAAAGLLWMFSAQQERRDAATVVSAAPAPRFQMRDAELIQYASNGRIRLQARAGAIRYYDDESLQMDAVQLSQLGGARVWTLRAPHGVAPPGERRLLLQQPVEADGHWPSGERFVLQTDRVWVDTLRREIYTDSTVTLTGESRQIRAGGLRADWGGRLLQLSDDVVARYEPKN